MQTLEQNKCPDCIFKTCDNCVKKAYVAVFEQPLEQRLRENFDEVGVTNEWKKAEIESLIVMEKQKSFEDGLRRAREVLPKKIVDCHDCDEQISEGDKGFNACREEVLKAMDKLK